MDQFLETVDLISLLADAPGHAMLWGRFLHELKLALACDSSALLITDLINPAASRFLYSAGIPVEYQHKYENSLNTLDIFNSFISQNPRRVFYNQTLNDEIIIEHIPFDEQYHRFGLSIPCNQQYSLSLLLNRKTRFNEAEQLRIQRILKSIEPSLDEAMHAEQRHKIHNQLRHYLGGNFDSYVIIDRQLTIIYSEPAFNSILSQMDCLDISEQQFGMKSSAMQQQLLSLMANNEGTKVIPNQCHSCLITFIPLRDLKNLYQWECYKDGFILAFSHEKDRNPMIDRLIAIHHLSKCEAICAVHFMNTPSIADIASSSFRSEATVRNHIKHAMQKMNVHSQAEFMKTLLTLTAL